MAGHRDPEFIRPLPDGDVDFLDEFAPELDADRQSEGRPLDTGLIPAAVAPSAGDPATNLRGTTRTGEEIRSKPPLRVYVGGVAAVLTLATYLALFKAPARSTDVGETS